MFEGFGSAIISGFILAFMVGPVFFTLIETSINKGFRAGVVFDAGAMFADVVFIFIAYFSTSKLLDRVKDDPALLIFGGAVLIAYGMISYIKNKRAIYKIVRAHSAVEVKRNFGSLFLKGFFLNFINFGVLAGWIGIIIIANTRTSGENGVIYFLITVMASFILTDLAKISLAKKLRHKMTPRFSYKTKQWVSILIAGFGVFLLLQGVFPDRINAELEKIPGQEILDPTLIEPIPPIEKPL
jgi:threonine/homoserine/homoserine lactone efflux protein